MPLRYPGLALLIGCLPAALAVSADPVPGLANPGPLSPREEQATFRVPAGFVVELVAAEPEVVDPVAIAFDEDGRMYVAEMRGYPNAGVATGSVHSGKIKMLEDKDGDGVYETATTYADGLRFPTSVMPWKGGLLAAVAPDLLYFEKAGGKSRTLYTGFNLENIQQLPSSLQWGLDNWVYACCGGKGGTITSPEKPDAPAVTLRGRGIRFRPDRPGSLEPTSGGGQFGLAADDFEHWFTATNSEHLKQIVLPDHYLRRNPYLAVPAVSLNIPDHGAACQVFRVSPFEAWRVERTTRRAGGPDARRFPATELVPGGFITSACSPLVYTAGLFPPAYRGDCYVCDPANNLVHRDKLVGDGPAVTARRADEGCEFLASTDNWFRPVNLTLGPDGAMYVVDFYREVIETPLSLPDDIKQRVNLETRGRGRIWRVRPAGPYNARKPALSQATTAELVRHLDDENPWWRFTAQRLLIERQDRSAIPILWPAGVKSRSSVGWAHALWTMHGLDGIDREAVMRAVWDSDPNLREQGLRMAEGLLKSSPQVRAWALKRADDPNPRVRFQAALTLGECDTPDAAEALAKILRRDAGDPWTQTAVLSSAAHTAPALLESLVKDAPPALLTRLASLIGAKGDEAEVARAFGLLAEAPAGAAWPAAVLDGLGQGWLAGGRSLSKLWDDPPAGLKAAAERARPFFQRAAETARDGKRPVAERLAAVRLLGSGPFAAGEAVWPELLAPDAPGDLQLDAVRALARHDNPRVAEVLLAGWAGYSPAVRREAVEALFARPERVRALLKAVADKRVAPSQLEPARLEQLRRHPNSAIRAQARTLLTAAVAPARQKVVDDYRPALELKNDAAHGKAVFGKVCATCHRLDNVGTQVGPDLLSALRNKTPEDLLVAILDPSREVDPRYLNYQVTAKSGRVFSGLIAAETPSSLTLRRAEGAEDTLLRDQIESVQATTQSLMPDGLEQQLSRQDLADLIAYLRAAGEPPAAPNPAAKPAGSFEKIKNVLLSYPTPDGELHPVRTAEDWAKRRADILRRMQEVMGPLPDPSHKVPLDVQVLEEVDLPKAVRRKITFAAESDDRVPAYLFLPKGQSGKRPAVLCLHQTTPVGKAEPAGVAGSKHLNYALELAERGYVTIAPDYPNFGDYKFDAYAHGYLSATMKGIWNHMRAVDLLQSLPEVDGERIGVMGHSLGGHNSLFVAAFDERIRCVVSNCGFCSFGRYKGGDLTGWSHNGYMPRIRTEYGRDPKRMPFDFPEVVAALAPRAFLAIAPLRDDNFAVIGVRECVNQARPVYDLSQASNRLAAEYPDCAHEFPPALRETAYRWMDRWLKGK
jgi:putative membrane-bound dehydrogenase-like protein